MMRSAREPDKLPPGNCTPGKIFFSVVSVRLPPWPPCYSGLLALVRLTQVAACRRHSPPPGSRHRLCNKSERKCTPISRTRDSLFDQRAHLPAHHVILVEPQSQHVLVHGDHPAAYRIVEQSRQPYIVAAGQIICPTCGSHVRQRLEANGRTGLRNIHQVCRLRQRAPPSDQDRPVHRITRRTPAVMICLVRRQRRWRLHRGQC